MLSRLAVLSRRHLLHASNIHSLVVKASFVAQYPICKMSSSAAPLEIKPGACRVGFIGIGVMGASMAGHILAGGYSLSVYNRTASKCAPLVEKGAKLCNTPRDVAAQSDVVLSIVGYPSDVRSVLLDKETGVLAGLRPGGIVVDLTTSEPALAEEVAREAAAKGIASVDAPVSGGDIGARNATLSIMCGGEKATIDALQPLFSLMGKNVKHMGPAGMGQHTKMVNQILIANNMIGVCEGLLYAYKAGLDPLKVIEAVGAGAAGSFSINVLGPRIAKRDFAPGFFVEHFIKDLGICLSEAKRMGIALPGLALANQLYVALQAQGHGRSGTQALITALETLNGIKSADVKPVFPPEAK
jgi:3-hydroxyisobutyrate dehydrogenase